MGLLIFLRANLDLYNFFFYVQTILKNLYKLRVQIGLFSIFFILGEAHNMILYGRKDNEKTTKHIT